MMQWLGLVWMMMALVAGRPALVVPNTPILVPSHPSSPSILSLYDTVFYVPRLPEPDAYADYVEQYVVSAFRVQHEIHVLRIQSFDTFLPLFLGFVESRHAAGVCMFPLLTQLDIGFQGPLYWKEAAALSRYSQSFVTLDQLMKQFIDLLCHPENIRNSVLDIQYLESMDYSVLEPLIGLSSLVMNREASLEGLTGLLFLNATLTSLKLTRANEAVIDQLHHFKALKSLYLTLDPVQDMIIDRRMPTHIRCPLPSILTEGLWESASTASHVRIQHQLAVALKSLKELSSLTLENVAFNIDFVMDLALEFLDIHYSTSDLNVRGLQGMTCLQVLSLSPQSSLLMDKPKTPVSYGGITAEDLNFETYGTLSQIESLYSLSSLKRLHLTACRLDTLHLGPLVSSFSYLQELILKDTDIHSLRGLGLAHATLQYLDITQNWLAMKNEMIRFSHQQELLDLRQLRHVRYSVGHIDESIATLLAMRGVELDIQEDDVDTISTDISLDSDDESE